MGQEIFVLEGMFCEIRLDTGYWETHTRRYTIEIEVKRQKYFPTSSPASFLIKSSMNAVL